MKINPNNFKLYCFKVGEFLRHSVKWNDLPQPIIK